MPANIVKPGQEKYWERAKKRAAEEGHEGDWAYVVGIFKRMTVNKSFHIMEKAGPFIGPRGGKWADAQHTIPWKEGGDSKPTSVKELRDHLRQKYGVKLDLHARSYGMELPRIEVPKEKRGQGIGNKVMGEILDFADQQGSTISLTPSSDFGGNKTKLKKWYKQLGFVENKGRNKDYEISESMYRLPKKMSKALVTWGDRPQTSLEGQVPGRNHGHAQGMKLDPELRALVEKTPPSWNVDRFYEKPIVKASDVVSGLGLTAVQEETLASLVRKEASAALNVLQLRKSLMQKFLTERYPPELRQVITSRAVQYMKGLNKSEPEILTPDELLQKADSTGGSYYRRVRKGNGKYRYFYSKEDYDKHGDAHVDGGDQRKKFLKNAIYKQVCKAGKEGCEAKHFEKLARRFGAQAIYETASALKSEGKLFYKGSKFYSSEKPSDDSGQSGGKEIAKETKDGKIGASGSTKKRDQSQPAGPSPRERAASKVKKSRFHVVVSRGLS